jgi:hypothetical protein
MVSSRNVRTPSEDCKQATAREDITETEHVLQCFVKCVDYG